jgi:peptidyl-prolyl cis-trans isomerase B (cyclophilin B)
MVALAAIAVACGPERRGSDAGARADEAMQAAAGSELLAADFDWPSGPRPRARIHVARFGVIELDLYPELAPETVANFVKLAEDGFYAGTTFHRIEPGFMIQGGDPNSKDKDPRNDGHGGPGYQIPDEFGPAPHVRGALSMANRGHPNSGGSQFFVVQSDHADHLDAKHALFGRVTAGMEAVDAIAQVEIDRHGRWGNKRRPIENVVIDRIEIISPVGATAGSGPDPDTPAEVEVEVEVAGRG